MQSSHIMAIAIVTIVMVAAVIRAAIAGRHRRDRSADPRAEADVQRLRDEVKQLKERLAVLERIAVEKESSLESEIERLRDR